VREVRPSGVAPPTRSRAFPSRPVLIRVSLAKLGAGLHAPPLPECAASIRPTVAGSAGGSAAAHATAAARRSQRQGAGMRNEQEGAMGSGWEGEGQP